MNTQDFSENLSVLIVQPSLEDYLLEKFKQINIVHYTDYTNSINYIQNSTEQISVILLDLHLPDRKGLELINGILSCNFRIPIIILTGYLI
jgi:FixJ family two-component response regulator